jgi:signal peptidase I
VVALGDPNRRIDSLGGARSYVGVEQWREYVDGLMSRAAAIIVMPSQTPGVLWELEFARVTTSSMMPTLSEGRYIVIEKWDRSVRRGDGVSFTNPEDPSVLWVKRIVAVGGDGIRIVRGSVEVNGTRYVSCQVDRVAGQRTETNERKEPGPERWIEVIDGRPHEFLMGEGRVLRSTRLKLPR